MARSRRFCIDDSLSGLTTNGPQYMGDARSRVGTIDFAISANACELGDTSSTGDCEKHVGDIWSIGGSEKHVGDTCKHVDTKDSAISDNVFFVDSGDARSSSVTRFVRARRSKLSELYDLKYLLGFDINEFNTKSENGTGHWVRYRLLLEVDFNSAISNFEY